MNTPPSDDDDSYTAPASFSIAYSVVPGLSRQAAVGELEQSEEGTPQASEFAPAKEYPIAFEAPSIEGLAIESEIPAEVVAAWLLDTRSLDRTREVIRLFQELGIPFSEIMDMDPNQFARELRASRDESPIDAPATADEPEVTLEPEVRRELRGDLARFRQIATNHIDLEQKRRDTLLDEADAFLFDEPVVVEERIRTNVHERVWREALTDVAPELFEQLRVEAQQELDADLEAAEERDHGALIENARRDFQYRVWDEAINLIVDPSQQAFYERRIENETPRMVRRYFWERQMDEIQDRDLLRTAIRQELQLELEIAELTTATQEIHDELENLNPDWAEGKIEEETQRRLKSDEILSVVYQQVDKRLKQLEGQIEEELQERTKHWRPIEREPARPSSSASYPDIASPRDSLGHALGSQRLRTGRTMRQARSDWDSTMSRIGSARSRLSRMVASSKGESTPDQYKTESIRKRRIRGDVRDIDFGRRPISREATGGDETSPNREVPPFIVQNPIDDEFIFEQITSIRRKKTARPTLKSIFEEPAIPSDASSIVSLSRRPSSPESRAPIRTGLQHGAGEAQAESIHSIQQPEDNDAALNQAIDHHETLVELVRISVIGGTNQDLQGLIRQLQAHDQRLITQINALTSEFDRIQTAIDDFQNIPLEEQSDETLNEQENMLQDAGLPNLVQELRHYRARWDAQEITVILANTPLSEAQITNLFVPDQLGRLNRLLQNLGLNDLATELTRLHEAWNDADMYGSSFDTQGVNDWATRVRAAIHNRSQTANQAIGPTTLADWQRSTAEQFNAAMLPRREELFEQQRPWMNLHNHALDQEGVVIDTLLHRLGGRSHNRRLIDDLNNRRREINEELADFRETQEDISASLEIHSKKQRPEKQGQPTKTVTADRPSAGSKGSIGAATTSTDLQWAIENAPSLDLSDTGSPRISLVPPVVTTTQVDAPPFGGSREEEVEEDIIYVTREPGESESTPPLAEPAWPMPPRTAQQIYKPQPLRFRDPLGRPLAPKPPKRVVFCPPSEPSFSSSESVLRPASPPTRDLYSRKPWWRQAIGYLRRATDLNKWDLGLRSKIKKFRPERDSAIISRSSQLEKTDRRHAYVRVNTGEIFRINNNAFGSNQPPQIDTTQRPLPVRLNWRERPPNAEFQREMGRLKYKQAEIEEDLVFFKEFGRPATSTRYGAGDSTTSLTPYRNAAVARARLDVVNQAIRDLKAQRRAGGPVRIDRDLTRNLPGDLSPRGLMPDSDDAVPMRSDAPTRFYRLRPPHQDDTSVDPERPRRPAIRYGMQPLRGPQGGGGTPFGEVPRLTQFAPPSMGTSSISRRTEAPPPIVQSKRPQRKPVPIYTPEKETSEPPRDEGKSEDLHHEQETRKAVVVSQSAVTSSSSRPPVQLPQVVTTGKISEAFYRDLLAKIHDKFGDKLGDKRPMLLGLPNTPAPRNEYVWKKEGDYVCLGYKPSDVFKPAMTLANRQDLPATVWNQLTEGQELPTAIRKDVKKTARDPNKRNMSRGLSGP